MGESASRMIPRRQSRLIVIDMQERLIPTIADHEEVVANASLLVRAAGLLDVPVLVTEHYPRGLGPTVEPLRGHFGPAQKIEKISFGAFGCEQFARALGEPNGWLVLCGTEAHVCVMQTGLQALDRGWRVAAVADAMGSRKRGNRDLALERLRTAGALIVSTEMIIFEWLERGGTPEFKRVLGWIR